MDCNLYFLTARTLYVKWTEGRLNLISQIFFEKKFCSTSLECKLLFIWLSYNENGNRYSGRLIILMTIINVMGSILERLYITANPILREF